MFCERKMYVPVFVKLLPVVTLKKISHAYHFGKIQCFHCVNKHHKANI